MAESIFEKLSRSISVSLKTAIQSSTLTSFARRCLSSQEAIFEYLSSNFSANADSSGYFSRNRFQLGMSRSISFIRTCGFAFLFLPRDALGCRPRRGAAPLRFPIIRNRRADRTWAWVLRRPPALRRAFRSSSSRRAFSSGRILRLRCGSLGVLSGALRPCGPIPAPGVRHRRGACLCGRTPRRCSSCALRRHNA